MTTTAPEPAPADESSGQGRSRLRTTTPPRGGRPGQPPQASRRPGPVRRLRVGGRPAEQTPVPGRPLVRRPTPTTRLPDPTAMCASVVRAAVEVLRGDRPATQIARWVTPQVLEQLMERARLVQAHGRRPQQAGVPVTVRRIRMVRLGDTSAEATVVVEDDGRVRAAAARIEVFRGTWRIAVLELG